jgi:protein TonB
MTMFETAVLSNGPQTKRMWTTLMGFSGQALLLTCLVLAPLISPASLPKVVWTTMTLAPPAPPPPPPGPMPQVMPRIRVASQLHEFIEPTTIPRTIAHIEDVNDPPPPTGNYVIGGIPGTGGGGGSQSGLIEGIVGAVPPLLPVVRPPEPVARIAPPPTPPPVPQRITKLQMAEPIQRVQPVYPQLARTAHVSGTVELMGVLGVDGRIHEIKVLSGHPLLVKAAVDAVLQWTYRPTVLNGQAVEVQAPISVRFILNN